MPVIIRIFIQSTVLHNTNNNFRGYYVSAYNQAIIRPIHYLELMRNPYNSTYRSINLGKISHSPYTHVIKLVKNGLKLDEKKLYIKTRIF